MRLIKTILFLGVGTFSMLRPDSSDARITWDLQPPGTNAYDWTLRQNWTFNRQGASGSYGNCNGDCNYHSLGADSYVDCGDPDHSNCADPDVSWGGVGRGAAAAAPMCLEVTTLPGQYTSNPDTVIEVQDNSGNWLMISDDVGQTWQSHARIWIEAVTTTMAFHLRIRAYSSYHNLDEFVVAITRRDLNKSQCTSGQTAIPWVQITDSGQAPFVTLSSFH